MIGGSYELRSRDLCSTGKCFTIKLMIQNFPIYLSSLGKKEQSKLLPQISVGAF